MEHDELLVLGASDVYDLFDLATASASQRRAFAELGKSDSPPLGRTAVVGPSGSVYFSYLAQVAVGTNVINKTGSFLPTNAAAGRETISALIIVFDETYGAPIALIDGTSVTTLRTAAASAVAADTLAPALPAAQIAILGSGVQARAHVRALAHELDVSSFKMWSPNRDHLAEAVRVLRAQVQTPIVECASARSAVTDCDIVATCTTSKVPVLEYSWLSAKTAVLSVGSFTPDRSEVPEELVRKAAAIVVDDIKTAADHAGPIIRALENSDIRKSDLIPLSSLLRGETHIASDRIGARYFNSVGIGMQDAAAAQAILARAAQKGFGQRVRVQSLVG